MTVQTVTLELPEPLYQRLQEQSQRRHTTVVQELYRLAERDPDELTYDRGLLWLNALSDDMLWQTARSVVDQPKQDRMYALFDKRDSVGLSDAEFAELRSIIDLGNRIMLLRAESALLLKKRGYDISELGPTGKNSP